MAQSVSNDALWEKLLEIDKKIDKFVPEQEQVDITAELKANKEEIVKKLEKYIQGLGSHCDSHFKSILTKTSKLDRDMADAIACLVYLIKEPEKQQKLKNTQSYFSFKFFKVKKTSLAITILCLLVFILTLFCMKQQNDYSILMGKYYRKSIVARGMQAEVDSLKNASTNRNVKKK